MHDYRTSALDASTESLFDTAVYRFLELYASKRDGLVAIHTEIDGPERQKTIRFWSADAASRFESFWREFRRERELSLPF
jgi:hypothetical protein